MPVQISGNELSLVGTVGDAFWEEGFTPGEVIQALAEVGREMDVTIRLNSGGGIATDGAAIHAALTAHKGKVTIVVEGIAASAASVIAMAGDEVVMSIGAVMMIHDPATITFGDAREHQKTINALDKLGDAYASVYAEKTGKSVSKMRDMMREETWMTADDAVKNGFADRLASDNDNEVVEIAAFAYTSYAKAPKAIVALAKARGWQARATMAAPAATNRKEQSMGKARAEFPPNEDDKKKTDAPADEGKGGSEEQDNPAPEEPADAGNYVLTSDEVEQIVNILANSGEKDQNLEEIIRDLQEASSVTLNFGSDNADPNEGDESDEGKPDDPDASDEDEEDVIARAAKITEMCTGAGHPALASNFIRAKASIQTVKARLDDAKKIKAMVANAKKANSAITANADEFINQGKSVDAVRASLFDQIVANQSPEVSPSLRDTKPKPQESSSAWDKSIEAQNARLKK